jgi:hypothetical protein
MILTQNSLVLHTNELDAIETDTYKNRSETVLCGSSMCRPKTSISKIKDISLFAADIAEYKAKNENKDEKLPALSELDMPEFNHFERSTPLRSPGRTKYTMSQRTKTKIRQKITAWSHTKRDKSNIKFTFITLTLTSKQIGTDKEYSRMLNTFFTYLRKWYPFKNYLYVNERQKNGNIHTHIVSDIFVPIAKINYIWCKILSENGYTFNGKPIFTPGTKSPNPVDIKCIYDLKRVSSYVTKYVTKNDSSFDSLIWNCSNTVSRLFTSVKIWDSKTFSVLHEHFRHTLEAKLSNGYVLHIHLLSLYHGIQKKHFKINESVLTGAFDREDFINKIRQQCKSNQPELA